MTLTHLRPGWGAPARLLGAAALLISGCALETSTQPPPAQPRDARIWIEADALCAGVVAVGAPVALTVHHPDGALGDGWRLQLASVEAAATLADPGSPSEAALDPEAEHTRLAATCDRPGRVLATVEDAAGTRRAEARFVCVPEAELPSPCGGRVADAGPPPDLAPDAHLDARPPPDGPLPAAELRVPAPGPVRLSWPAHPVDGAPDHLALEVRVTRGEAPVAGAWVGAPDPEAPVWVEAAETDAQGLARITVHPMPYRGTGALRLSAQLPDDERVDADQSLSITTVSAPVSQLLLRCDPGLVPGLGRVTAEGAIQDVVDEQALCRVLALDNAGGAVPAAPVVLQAEAGRVPPEVLTDETGTAHFAWWTDGPLPYARYDEHGPQDALVALLAWTAGREGFVDVDGRPGRFAPGVDLMQPDQDLGEPFLDLDGDGRRDEVLPRPEPGGTWVTEPYLDANGNRDYDPANGDWDANAIIWTQLQAPWVGPAHPARSALAPPDAREGLCGDGPALQADVGQRYRFELQAADAFGRCPWGEAQVRVQGSAELVDPAETIDLSEWCDAGLQPLPIPVTVTYDGDAPAALTVTLEGPPGVAPTRLSYSLCP